MKNALRVCALIALSELMASCDRVAPDWIAPSGLECGSSDWGLFGKFCSLKPSKQFLGISLGQASENAFRGFCATSNAVNARKWILLTFDHKKTFVGGRAIRCSDSQYFRQSNMWLIWSRGEPCATGSDRTIDVSMRDGRVHNMSVNCRGLIDDLADDLFGPKVPASVIAYQRKHFVVSVKDGVATYERKERADSGPTRERH